MLSFHEDSATEVDGDRCDHILEDIGMLRGVLITLVIPGHELHEPTQLFDRITVVFRRVLDPCQSKLCDFIGEFTGLRLWDQKPVVGVMSDTDEIIF